MKLWLHFSEALWALRKEMVEHKDNHDNNDSCLDDLAAGSMSVIDVTLSNYTETKIYMIFKMQEMQEKINDIKSGIYAGAFTEDQYINKCNELKLLMKKLKKAAENYKQLTK